MISGHRVQRVLVPALEIMSGESLACLARLAERGVFVMFADRLPAMLLDPRDGSEKPVERGVQVTVPAMRAIFVVV